MKAFVFAWILMLAAASVAQQPGSEQAQPPSGTKPQPAHVQQDIQQAWRSQSDLRQANLNAQVRGGAVTLTGTVGTEQQRQMAVQVATLHASGMKIVDKIRVQPQNTRSSR